MRQRASVALGLLGPRGPDGARLETGKDWLLGHTRLAILDLSEHATQPMADAKGRWLVFNGEIYNFRELRAELEAAGIRCKSTGDSEVLLHALGHWGLNVLPRLRGMFAFAWADPGRHELVLARDRYGVKPLVWESTPDGVRFASDLFGLDGLAGGARNRTIDPDAARRYLMLGYLPAPLTIWSGVRKLRPGHFVRARWSLGGAPAIEERSYWTIAKVPPAAGRAGADAPGEFAAKVQEAVALRLISDVPVGLLLSGGLDSSLVAAASAELPGARMPSFTMGFDDAEADERPLARATAGRLGLVHREFRAENVDIAALFAEAWRAFDEPFADSSALPTMLLCREICRHVKVAVGGDGGDEVWAGYPWHRALHRAIRWLGVPAAVRWHASRLAQLGGGSTAYKARVVAGRDRLGMFAVLRSGLNDAMTRWLPVKGDPLPVRELFRDGAELVGDVPDPVDWAGRMDLVTYLPDDLMVKSDRASMRFGLELREPLLDHELTAWGLSLPLGFRYDAEAGRGKVFAREYLKQRLPAEVLDHPKHGFTPPLSKWLNGPLQAIKQKAIASLESGTLAPFELPERVRSWAECADKLDDRHHQFLWRIICFHGWLKSRLC
jgi:asparagine synthase (glutamine-hydrolysing)